MRPICKLAKIVHTTQGGALRFSEAGMHGEFVETLPVEDVFVSGLGKVESLGNGLLRFYLCSPENGLWVVKVRLVIPVACAVEMNTTAGEAIETEFRKTYPLRLVT